MTVDEFQLQYHDYNTRNMKEAIAEVYRVNAKAEGFTVEAVEFPGIGIALMISDAAEYVKEIGLL